MTSNDRKELEALEKKPVQASQGEPTYENVMFVPDVDIIENSEAITLFADMPGVSKENLSIDARDGVLNLTGKVDVPDKKLKAIYREYEEGGFTRKFTLGEKIDTEKISAKLTNGVLTLVLPKAEAHKPRKIQIS